MKGVTMRGMTLKAMDTFLGSIYCECIEGRALVLADDLESAIACGQLVIKPAAVNVLRSLANLLRSAGEDFDLIETEGGNSEWEGGNDGRQDHLKA